MMDELHLTEDELKMIQRGETPGAVETLERLRERFRAVWVVTSTTCLLDMKSDNDVKVDLPPEAPLAELALELDHVTLGAFDLSMGKDKVHGGAVLGGVLPAADIASCLR